MQDWQHSDCVLKLKSAIKDQSTQDFLENFLEENYDAITDPDGFIFNQETLQNLLLKSDVIKTKLYQTLEQPFTDLKNSNNLEKDNVDMDRFVAHLTYNPYDISFHNDSSYTDHNYVFWSNFLLVFKPDDMFFNDVENAKSVLNFRKTLFTFPAMTEKSDLPIEYRELIQPRSTFDTENNFSYIISLYAIIKPIIYLLASEFKSAGLKVTQTDVFGLEYRLQNKVD